MIDILISYAQCHVQFVVYIIVISDSESNVYKKCIHNKIECDTLS